MSEVAKRQFVRQQGFGNIPAGSCEYQYSALMFQPRLFAVLVLLAIVLQSLAPAPAPRRFSQGMAGTILGGAGLALLAGQPRLAWILEGFVVVALGALVLGRFCLGSYLYYVLRGETGYANRTVPWSRVE